MANQIETNLFEELSDKDLALVVGGNGDAIVDGALKFIDYNYDGTTDYLVKQQPITKTQQFVANTVKEA